MTPLAQRLAKQLTVRPRDRSVFWRGNEGALKGLLNGTHFFEATQALPLLDELVDALKRSKDSGDELFQTYTFLPAPKTWIEYIHPIIGRMALAICEPADSAIKLARVDLVWDKGAASLGEISTCSDDYKTYGGKINVPDVIVEKGIDGAKFQHGMVSSAHLFLLMINSPKIIGRKQHMPHAGLERRLTKTFGVGAFPLQAWHELTLNVAKPAEIDDGLPHEAHLTGRRALHFVRKHVRVRLGKLEYVSSHWRGDAALGVKQTKYKIAP